MTKEVGININYYVKLKNQFNNHDDWEFFEDRLVIPKVLQNKSFSVITRI